MKKDILKVTLSETKLEVESDVPLPKKFYRGLFKELKKILKLKDILSFETFSKDKKSASLLFRTGVPIIDKKLPLYAIAYALRLNIKKIHSFIEQYSSQTNLDKILIFEMAIKEQIGENAYKIVKELLIKHGFIDEDLNPKEPSDLIYKFLNNMLMQKANIRICPLCLNYVFLTGRSAGRRLFCESCRKKAVALEKRKQRMVFKISRLKKFLEKYKKNTIITTRPQVTTVINQIRQNFEKEHQPIIAYLMLVYYCKEQLNYKEFSERLEMLKPLHELAKPFIFGESE